MMRHARELLFVLFQATFNENGRRFGTLEPNELAVHRFGSWARIETYSNRNEKKLSAFFVVVQHAEISISRLFHRKGFELHAGIDCNANGNETTMNIHFGARWAHVRRWHRDTAATATNQMKYLLHVLNDKRQASHRFKKNHQSTPTNTSANHYRDRETAVAERGQNKLSIFVFPCATIYRERAHTHTQRNEKH